MKRFLGMGMASVLAASFNFVALTQARADSCWNHNGSILRLQAQGNIRWWRYEQPRHILQSAGVRRGTLFFDGRKNGNWYSGTARVFFPLLPRRATGIFRGRTAERRPATINDERHQTGAQQLSTDRAL